MVENQSERSSNKRHEPLYSFKIESEVKSDSEVEEKETSDGPILVNSDNNSQHFVQEQLDTS